METISKIIGIDHIALYAPQQYLSLEDLAKARGVNVAKYTVGIGIKEATVVTPPKIR
jgi:hydroxymethylglutaryl-CoA synthase